jgi:hypothetical protein
MHFVVFMLYSVVLTAEKAKHILVNPDVCSMVYSVLAVVDEPHLSFEWYAVPSVLYPCMFSEHARNVQV